MTNLECFIQSLKLTWINRLLKCGASPWCILFEETVCVKKISCFGSQWFKHLVSKSQNQFWKDVFLAWIKISRPVKSNIDFIYSVLWYNPDISDTPLFYPTWFRNGITFVGDILNNEGQITSKAEIENLY